MACLTFAQAVAATGVTPRTLRGWLDRAQVALDHDRERAGAGWRRFSTTDCVRLALVGTLVGYCVPVPRASQIAVHVLKGYALGDPADRLLVVWRDGDAFSHATCSIHSPPALVARPHGVLVHIGEIAKAVANRLVTEL